jgi:hypothetical protein
MISALLLALIASALGFYILKSIRGMMRSGRSYFVFDVRRLFLRRTPEHSKQDDEIQFWVAIAFNSFFATIALALAVTIFAMFAIGFGALLARYFHA